VKVVLDSNILVYGEGVNGVERQRLASRLVADIPIEDIVVPIQVLGEFFNVLVKKARYSRERARAATLQLIETFSTFETTVDVIAAAVDLAREHNFGIWDAVILSVASHAHCQSSFPRTCMTASPGAVSLW
jgi:predicted nucleic acid-binding protein